MTDFAIPDDFIVDIVNIDTGEKSAHVTMGEIRRFHREGTLPQFREILSKYNTKLSFDSNFRWE
jgi:hypothetical protein